MTMVMEMVKQRLVRAGAWLLTLCCSAQKHKFDVLALIQAADAEMAEDQLAKISAK